MRIVVLAKLVPDIEKVRFDVERGVVDRSSAPAEANPFDLNALEAAVQIKERLGGTVTVISMSPPQATSMLRDMLARGADRAILLTDKRFAGADTLATSYTLASAVRKLGEYDLIICGEKTVDGDTGQVGPEVAEHLGIPHVAYVSEIRHVTRKSITVISEMDTPLVVEMRLPGLITVTKDINKPRLPTLKDKLRARKAQIEIWTADDLAEASNPERFGLAGSPTRVVKITVPGETGRKGRIFRGADAAQRLAEILAEVALGGGR